MDEIEKNNQDFIEGKCPYMKGENKFTDMLYTEVINKYTGLHLDKSVLKRLEQERNRTKLAKLQNKNRNKRQLQNDLPKSIGL